MIDDISTMIASIDITGSNRSWDMTYVSSHDLEVHHLQLKGSEEDKLNGISKWVGSNRPLVIAIDAPSGPNLGKTKNKDVRLERGWETEGRHSDKYFNMRLCEADLTSRNIQLYYTPSNMESAQSWIKTGWKLYQSLENDFGYARLRDSGLVPSPSQPLLIEIHPHASFVVALGWIPLNKDSLSGQLERAACLLHSVKWGGKPMTGKPLPNPDLLVALKEHLNRATWEDIRSGGIQLDTLLHDVLDSVVGLVTVVSAIEGQAWAVGDPDEGVIVVPGTIQDKYANPLRSASNADPRG